MLKHINELKNAINNLSFIFKLISNEKHGTTFIVFKFVLSIIQTLFSIIHILVPGLILNELTSTRRIINIFVYVGIVLFAPFVQQIISLKLNFRIKKNIDSVKISVNRKIFSHSVDMDYENYERAEYNVLRDRVHDMVYTLEQNIDYCVGLFSSFISLIITLFLIGKTLNFLILILICINVVINTFLTSRINKKVHNYEKEAEKWNNYNWAYRNSLVYNWNIKDIRIFDLKKIIIDAWTKYANKENAARHQAQKAGQLPSYVSSLCNLLQGLIVYTVIIYKILENYLKVGDLSIALSAINQFSSSLSKISHNYLKILSNSMKISEGREYLKLPLKQKNTGCKTPTFNKNSIIEFHNVSFKYPGSDTFALKNLNVSFRANEKLCIVGHNGAGKTTFVKLLLRLYEPTEGEIFLDGINIYEFDYLKYQKLFSPIFQDGGCFNLTVGENITLCNQWDEEKVKDVCLSSGLQGLVEKLPQGYNTQVGKWLDPNGFEPSGGEEQRFKIARSIYHGGEIFVMDEPTASIDPLTEYDIYTKFDEMIQKKTAILITHRLSAVHLGDKIAVFQKGNVVEYGTHKELLSKDGIYSEMYKKQSSFYNDIKKYEDKL